MTHDTLELQMKVREDFTITEKAPTRWCPNFFNTCLAKYLNRLLYVKAPSRDFLRDCEIFVNLRLQL